MDQKETQAYIELRINECDLDITRLNNELQIVKSEPRSKANMDYIARLLHKREVYEAKKNAYMDIWTRLEGLRDGD